MNIPAWLRKLGPESLGPAFRTIDIDAIQDPRSADLQGPSLTFLNQPEMLRSAITAPSVTPKQPSESAQSRRFGPVAGVSEQHRPTPFVGRKAELRRLLAAQRRAAAGHGQVVLLSGAAGVGKSRIVRELCMAQPQKELWHHCSPERTFSPLHPVTGREQVPGLSDASCPHPDSTPQRLRSQTFELLLARIEQLAQQQAVLAVYEDLQWADPSTLEFLDRLVDRIPSLPILAVMTFRPDFEAAWHGHAHAVPLALPALEHGACQAMIHHLAEGESLAEPVLEHIIVHSAGVPLLVEELTRAALEVSDEIDPDKSADAAAVAAIPSTLREALIARLAQSSDSMMIAQIGAVIGCEFSDALITAVFGWPQERLRSALDQLMASEIVVRCGSARDAVYRFRHALIRDAAYDSMDEPLRRQLHGGLARILATRWPDVASDAPDLLARHYSAAGLAEPAVACWLRAGQRASERCAHAEAIAMFCKGLDLIDHLPSAREPAAVRAELLAGLAQALIATKGPAAPEVEQACDMARTLCQRAGEVPRLFPTVRNLWEHYNTRGHVEAACELAEQCQRLAAGAPQPNLVAEADFCLGVSSLFVGRLAEARERLNRSVVGSDVRCRRDLVASEMRDPRTIALVHLAHASWLCGYPEQAVRVSQEAVATARAAGHPFTLTYALLGASWLSQLGRDVPATRALAADALACATEEGFPAFLAMARIIRDWASIDTEPAEGLAAAVRAALGDYRTTGMGIARPYLLSLLADVHGALLETGPALEVLNEAAEVASATGERWYEPEIRRREGELLLRQSITNRRVASARFCQAIAVAQQQGGKSLELRAAVSLARLWADVGRRSQARDLLAPIYDWFKEGFETADLKDAAALLDEVR